MGVSGNGLTALRVNVGCGPLPLPGYVNLDKRAYAAWEGRADCRVHDVREGLPFADGSIAEVRGDQFPEHLSLPELAAFLQECRRVLAERGEVRLSFPDMIGIAQMAAAGGLDGVLPANGREPTPGVPAGLTVMDMVARCEAWGHVTCLTVELLQQMVQAAGLAVDWIARCGTNGLVIARQIGDGTG